MTLKDIVARLESIDASEHDYAENWRERCRTLRFQLRMLKIDIERALLAKGEL